MNKIRIAKAIVDDKESLIVLTIDPDGKKMCMTMAELDSGFGCSGRTGFVCGTIAYLPVFVI